MNHPWMLSLGDGIAGLAGGRVFAWDRAWADGRGGIAEYAATDGRLVRTRTIDGLHIKGRFEYAPVHYTIGLDDLRFRGTAPDLTLQQLTGGLAVRNDNLYLDNDVRTGESRGRSTGWSSGISRSRTEAGGEGHASLPELSRVAPPVEGYALTPSSR
jgi:hypothetical protein